MPKNLETDEKFCIFAFGLKSYAIRPVEVTWFTGNRTLIV